MQFDLAQVDTKTLSEAGVDMPVKDLAGKTLVARNGQPVVITLLGSDSTKYRSLTRVQVRKRMEQMAGGKALLSDADMDETDRDVLDVIVSCTIGWKNVLDTAGAAITFSDENLRKLYAAYPVVRDQAESFITVRANFIPPSSQG